MSYMVKLVFVCSAAVILSGCSSRMHFASGNVNFSSPQGSTVEVMTFNIRTKTFLDGPNGWKWRKNIVFDLLADRGADVVGLQEVRYSQFKQIRSALPEYGCYAVGRSDGLSRGESCPILYRKDRYLVADQGTFWFSDTPDVVGSKDWGNLPPRICTWARLVDKRTRQGLYVYNLHLDNLSQSSREKSVHLLTQRVSQRKYKDPFIVMGDFNMELDNPAMQYMQNLALKDPRTKWLDIWRFIPHRSMAGTRHGFDGGRSGPQIDHISTNQEVQVTQCIIDDRSAHGRYPSDHFPVIAKIILGKKTALNYSRATVTDSGNPDRYSRL